MPVVFLWLAEPIGIDRLLNGTALAAAGTSMYRAAPLVVSFSIAALACSGEAVPRSVSPEADDGEHFEVGTLDASRPDGSERLEAGTLDASMADGHLADDGGLSEDRISITVPPENEVAWQPCGEREAWPDGFPPIPRDLECARVEVPWNHAEPEGTKFMLRIARHRATNGSSGRAVFQLAGGPGGSAVAQSAIVPRLLPRLREEVDLVYVDQRGTGGSGYLDCAVGYPDTAAAWGACAAEQTEPLDHHLSADAADDLEWMRQLLRYEKVGLRGGSYGTRVGLEYLRRHGEHVEAAVLDGLAPPDSRYFETFIVNFDRGLTRLIADCEASESCRSVAPDLGTELSERRRRLRASPRPIRVNGQIYQEDEATYREFLYGALLEASTRFRIPRAIHQAMAGDHRLWNALMSDLSGLRIEDGRGIRAGERLRLPRRGHRGQSYVSPGLFMTVTCAEARPNEPDLAALEMLAAAQVWGDGTTLETHKGCAAWPVAPVSSAQREPVRSDVPVLLLNGDLDLNTFPEEGARAALTLSRSVNLIIPHATHSTMLVPCVADMLSAFLLSGGEAPNTACLDALTPPAW